jgi:hypothetical protein
MDIKNSVITDYNVGDIFLKKDGHKMVVSKINNKPFSENTISFSGSIEFKVFVHKSSENFKQGNFAVTKYFLQTYNFDDQIATKKFSVLEGYKKQV